MGVIKSASLRKSAQGEDCTLNIAGVCNYNNETVVLNHLPSDIAGHKSTDLSSCYGCSCCHACIDDRSRLSAEDYYFYTQRAQVRTLTRMEERGLIVVKGA